MATPRREEKKARELAARNARIAAQRRQRRMKALALLVVLAVLIGAIGLLATLNNHDKNKTSAAASTSTTATTAAAANTPKAQPVAAGQSIKGTTPCPAVDGSSPRASSFEKAPPTCIDPAKHYTATFDTTQGTIVVALNTTKTPVATNNFVVLALYHYYDGSAIFRTDPSIDIIQGGGPSTQDNTDPGPGYTIPDEGTPFTYNDGDLVMANTGSPNTSGAQFFFGAGPNVSQLNSQGSYINFGHATSGGDVLHKILALNVDNNSGLGGAPSTLVVVNKVTITAS